MAEKQDERRQAAYDYWASHPINEFEGDAP